MIYFVLSSLTTVHAVL